MRSINCEHGEWTWWTEAQSFGPNLPSVLWCCWLGHFTHKNPSPILPIMCLVWC